MSGSWPDFKSEKSIKNQKKYFERILQFLKNIIACVAFDRTSMKQSIFNLLYINYQCLYLKFTKYYAKIWFIFFYATCFVAVQFQKLGVIFWN